MPIDPTIALQYQGPQFGNALLQGQQLKGLSQQNQLRNLQIKAAQTEEAVSVLPQYLSGVKDQETYSMARDAFMAKYPGSVPLPEQYPGPEIMQRLVTWSANPKEAAKGLITKQVEMTKQANVLGKLRQQHQNALELEKLKQGAPYTLGKGQQRYSGVDNALVSQNIQQEQVPMYGQNALGRDITREIFPQHQEAFERAGWSQDKPLYRDTTPKYVPKTREEALRFAEEKAKRTRGATGREHKPSAQAALKRISDIQKTKVTLGRGNEITSLIVAANPDLAPLLGQKIDEEMKQQLFDAWESEIEYLKQFVPKNKKNKRTVVRKGVTENGQRVVQYSDGTIEYE